MMSLVFTPAGQNPESESNAGMFYNRGNYYSALKKQDPASMTYREITVKVPNVYGKVAFENEALLTKKFNDVYPYIKTIDNLIDISSWDTVTANFKLMGRALLE